MVSPTLEYSPAAQLAEAAAGDVHFLPDSHGVQVAELAIEYVPVGHIIGAVFLSGHENPTGQAVHAV